jgi:hypothetical protein
VSHARFVVRIAKRLEDSMQQAQQDKVVVATESKDEREHNPPQLTPVPLDAELFRLVGGGESSAPKQNW